MQKTITAFEIPSIDFDRAVKFYSAVLGGEVNIVDFVGHEGLKKGILPHAEGGIAGAIVCVPEYTKPSDQGVNVYLYVSDLDTALQETEKMGGKIVVPKTDAGETATGEKAGEFAWIIDSEGNRVALNQPE